MVLGMIAACAGAMGEEEPVVDAGRLEPTAWEILAKLEGTVIPEVDLTGATMNDAVNVVAERGGVSFVLKGGEGDVAKAGKVTYQGKDVRLLDAVAEIARQCGRDAYVTSSSILLTDEGAEPGGEVWKVVRVKRGDDAKKLLEGVRMPVVDFENTSVGEAVDFLRVRTMEMDFERTEKKGISFVERKPRAKEVPVPGYPLSEEEQAVLPMLTYSAKDVTFGGVLREIARQAGLDVYLTTGGLLLRPTGTRAFESEREEAARLVEVIYRWEGK